MNELTGTWHQYDPEAEEPCAHCHSKRIVDFDPSSLSDGILRRGECLDCGAAIVATSLSAVLDNAHEWASKVEEHGW